MTHVAILGAGSIARSMAATLRGMRDRGEPVSLYAVASRDPDRAQAFAREEGFARAYGSYEEMLADPAVSLVYIATPHSHHLEHMKLAIAHGRHVLCEKAFTANAAQAQEAIALGREKGVLVAEAIWTRYMPSREILRGLIDGGAIGEPRMLSASLFYPIEQIERIRRPELAGGALLDVGVYPLNFASMMFGDGFTRIDSSVQLMDTGVDRQETITLHYADGRTAMLSAGTSCRGDRRCVVSGTAGYLTVDNVNNPTHIELFRAEDGFAQPEVIPLPEQITGYEYEVRACLRAIEAGAVECPEMPHGETLAIMQIMDDLRAQWGVRYPFE